MRAVSELAVVTVGITYVIGVLVVNCDLARFGIISLDLARPEYVLAGVLGVLLLRVAALVDTVVIVLMGSVRPALRGTLNVGRVARSLSSFVALG